MSIMGRGAIALKFRYIFPCGEHIYVRPKVNSIWSSDPGDQEISKPVLEEIVMAAGIGRSYMGELGVGERAHGHKNVSLSDVFCVNVRAFFYDK